MDQHKTKSNSAINKTITIMALTHMYYLKRKPVENKSLDRQKIGAED
jgi:hypothetical protein